jgi:hypothetical protein
VRKGQFRKSLPAQNKVHTVRHHAALGIDETPALIAELSAKVALGPRAFDFCILTATRTSGSLEAVPSWRIRNADNSLPVSAVGGNARRV